LSAVRYTTFFGHRYVPHSVTFVVDAIYLSNGLFNVLLFSVTRPFLLPHDPPNRSPDLAFEPEEIREIPFPQIHEPVHYRPQTEMELSLPRHGSPVNYLGPPPVGGSEGGSTVRWSAALSYDTNEKSPSMRSIGW
jgi:hypothetical protein